MAWAGTIDRRPGSTKQRPCEGADKADVFGGTVGGDDYIVAKAGNDVAYGGPGNDSIADSVFPDSDWVAGGDGDDSINVRDGDAQDAVCTGPGTDTVLADAGDRVDDPFEC